MPRSARSRRTSMWLQSVRGWTTQNSPSVSRFTCCCCIAGSRQDAQWLEKRIATAGTISRSTNLSALLGAYIELRGPAGIEQVEKLYLADSARTKPEIEAALIALKVHAETDSAARDGVNKAVECFLKRNPSMANLAAGGFTESEIKIAPVSAAR